MSSFDDPDDLFDLWRSLLFERFHANTRILFYSQMSHPQPPQRQPTDTETIKYARTLHNTAVVAVIACPLLALLPPRKLDFYTFGLGGATIFSANWLVRERTGRSAWQHLGFEGNRPGVNDLAGESTVSTPVPQTNASREIQESIQDAQRLRNNSPPSVTEEVRSTREAWKVRQQKEIQDDIEEGKGLGDMIMDQIWEVWHWRKKGDDDE